MGLILGSSVVIASERRGETVERLIGCSGRPGSRALRNRLDGTNSRALSRTNSGSAAPPSILSRRTVKRHDRVSVHERVCAVGRKTRRRTANQRRSNSVWRLAHRCNSVVSRLFRADRKSAPLSENPWSCGRATLATAPIGETSIGEASWELGADYTIA